MRKYKFCLFLFLAVSAACMFAGYMAKQYDGRREVLYAKETELQTEFETETAAEEHVVVNQEQVLHETVTEEYYLVAEDGFLLVFLKDKKTICLYTHVPVMDFPSGERDRLREGIWFSSMMEVFNYLESYTS